MKAIHPRLGYWSLPSEWAKLIPLVYMHRRNPARPVIYLLPLRCLHTWLSPDEDRGSSGTRWTFLPDHFAASIRSLPMISWSTCHAHVALHQQFQSLLIDDYQFSAAISTTLTPLRGSTRVILAHQGTHHCCTFIPQRISRWIVNHWIPNLPFSC